MKKAGDVINGYVVVSEPRTVANGTVAFVEREGTEYFMKMFNRYTMPSSDSAGSERSKAHMREKATKFESRTRRINDLIAGKALTGGNFVITLDFFCWEQKFYKISQKIDIASVTVAEISRLPLKEKLLVPLTLSSALGILHNSGVVHGDLKPDNVLITLSPMAERIVTRLIDYDDAFFSGDPHEDIVGDQIYYAPEAALWALGGDHIKAYQLTTATDIFSLGILLHLYVYGTLPGFDARRFEYIWESIMYRAVPEVGGRSDNHPGLNHLISQMLDIRPENRPDINNIRNTLKSLRVTHPVHGTVGDTISGPMKIKFPKVEEKKDIPKPRIKYPK